MKQSVYVVVKEHFVATYIFSECIDGMECANK